MIITGWRLVNLLQKGLTMELKIFWWNILFNSQTEECADFRKELPQKQTEKESDLQS